MSQADAWRTREALRFRRNVNQAYQDGYRIRPGPYGTWSRDPMPDISPQPWIRGASHFDTIRRGWQFAKDFAAEEVATGVAARVRDGAYAFFDKHGFYPKSAVRQKRRREEPGLTASGTYSGVVWRPGGAARWDRGPKGWDTPDQPWPDTAATAGASGVPSAGGKAKSHFNSKVRYERY